MSTIPAVAAPELTPMLEEIATTLLASAAASISWAGISTTFRMFEVEAQVVKDGTGGNALLRINNDSGGNYDDQRVTGNSTSVGAGRGTGQTSILVVQAGPNTVATATIVIGKQVTGSAGMVLTGTAQLPASDLSTRHTAGRWNNTADLISRIDLISSAGNFAAETFAILRGDRSS